MALARTRSVTLTGVDGHLVEVEVDLADGLPGLTMVGLPDAVLHEARDRIRSAVTNSGEAWPARRITIALSPAALPKRGSLLDTALAVAVLAAAGAVPADPLAAVVLLGELALDGRLRPTAGMLPAVLAAARGGVRRVVVPEPNAPEAALVPDVDVRGAERLADLIAFLRGEADRLVVGRPGAASARTSHQDLADVAGQAAGRRAVEVAAAGGHHLFLAGPPGAGKTMLAERLPGILPPLDDAPALEVTAVHSIAGLIGAGAPLVRQPPYQAPHHTASMAALVGGGSRIAGPGAISLAHRGVLFLDEAPEFARGVLDAMRQPLERGEVVIARSGGQVRFPARFQLVLAANPCPCASPGGDVDCACTPMARRRYLSRLSGPLLDRIDLHVWLLPVTAADLLGDSLAAESSEIVAKRVVEARHAAAERLAGTAWRANAEVPGTALRSRWRLPSRVTALADEALHGGWLGARGYDRVLRIAWSLSDLGGRTSPDADDIAEAVGLRSRLVAA
ncbi:MAG TPA: YifB family Mg chelatase-like AAA ATPase [Mycobacteriales bacterium]|nr:YifB family Mg chelatase-like AAA ATPase [Mycobacteriales bacterium]